ncbi:MULTISPECIES: hypothetical protein [Prosthecobacter]|uniref:Uncharacterized protein n=2 Tax=Prosthecobacter TaxID=48463 RepID=A0A7W7YE60_9BACT|nr:hypothetical protein [Prosthecobacter vanneervenii]MBB5034531.1 hypothetical protein [Prosthecobacter vanneervenii]
MNENQQPIPHGLDMLSRLDETRVHFLWHFDWWDGPLHGLAEYDGQKAWFVFHDMDELGRHYYYRLYLLTDAQAAEAELWYATRGTYDAATQRWLGRDEVRHDSSWVGPDVSARQPIGWFADGSNSDFYGIQVIRNSHC